MTEEVPLPPVWDPHSTAPVTVADDFTISPKYTSYTWSNTRSDGKRYTDSLTAPEVYERLRRIAILPCNDAETRTRAAELANELVLKLDLGQDLVDASTAMYLPDGHRTDGLVCQVPEIHLGGAAIKPVWPQSLTAHGWDCQQCGLEYRVSGYGPAIATMYVHALTCGRRPYGPRNVPVRESVWEQIGADTGWSGVLEDAQSRADAAEDQLGTANEALTAARTKATEAETARKEAAEQATAAKKEAEKYRRRARIATITVAITTLCAVVAMLGAVAATLT